MNPPRVARLGSRARARREQSSPALGTSFFSFSIEGARNPIGARNRTTNIVASDRTAGARNTRAARGENDEQAHRPPRGAPGCCAHNFHAAQKFSTRPRKNRDAFHGQDASGLGRLLLFPQGEGTAEKSAG